MDEQTSRNEVNNQGEIQALNLGVHNSTIVQNFQRTQEMFWDVQISPVKDLRSKSFKLGDDAAANFPYIIEPVKDVYNQAIQLLQEAIDPVNRVKSGLLFLGESNSGKTRLALESMKQVLSEWFILRWQPYYTTNHIPSMQAIREKSLVLFLDDLHEYVSVQNSEKRTTYTKDNLYSGIAPPLENPCVVVLRELLAILLQVTPNIVIIATCRTEYLEKLNAEFGEHLLIRLGKLYLPSFTSDFENFQTISVIEAFRQKGHIYLDDWDGTIGSIVLGLSRKYEQYTALPRNVQIILKAIKLLAYVAIFNYPEEYIRRICIAIFPDADNLHDEVLWQAATGLLLQKQFIMETYNETAGRLALTIRSDSYLGKVISDYPPPGRSIHIIEQDISRLLKVLLDIGDLAASSRVALSFLMNGYYKKALDAYNHINEIDDNDTSNWNNKGVALILTERIEEALQAHKKAIEIDKTNISARINEQYCLKLLKRYDEALCSCEQLLVFDPEDAYFWMCKGTCLEDLKQFDKALEALDQASSLDTNFMSIWNNSNFDIYSHIWHSKFACLFALKMFSEALEAFDKSYFLNKDVAAAWGMRGFCLEQLDKYDEAVESYERSLILNPGSVSIQLRKGICLRFLKRYDEALKIFDQFLVLEPENISAWYNKGLCFECLGRSKEASMAFENVIPLNVEEEDSWYDKTHCLEKLGRYEEAIRIYEQRLASNPKKPSDWDAIGVNFALLKRPINALQAFEKALALDSSNSEIWRHKGKCLLDDLNRYKEALNAFERALNLDPTNTPALIGKGICLAQWGRFEESLEIYDQILIIDSTNVFAISNKGTCLLELGRVEEALSFFEQALANVADTITHEDKATYARIWYSIGICLGALEKYEEALNAFDQSIALDHHLIPAWVSKAKYLQLSGHSAEAKETLQKSFSFSSIAENRGVKIYQEDVYHISNNAPNNKVISNKKKHHRKLQQKSRKVNRKKR